MSNTNHDHKVSRLTLSGLVITLGIVYGDIGTSPLYVFNAIFRGFLDFREEFVLGAISCIVWTLTLQTTIKYVLITLSADNHGEGGIFALFALIRKKYAWGFAFAIIGGSTLLADGIITPSITVTSAVEGLQLINDHVSVIPIVLLILTVLFFVQQFGTKFIGKYFGPIMFLWFMVIALLGVNQIIHYPSILRALNPEYAIRLITEYPATMAILGAVFLATTGAEALYSDLGHCGANNIRISWIYVKITLILSYMGQGVWVLNHTQQAHDGTNIFYALMPDWFLIPGVMLATTAAVIASQALISGSFTLVSEAMSLNFWPRFTLRYPSDSKGQVYIPQVNWFLWAACCFVVLYFKMSTNMEAAYGLSITITMLMTTLLLCFFIYNKKTPIPFIIWFLIIFGTIEGTFLYANVQKFWHGGWFTIVMAMIFVFVMYFWYQGRKIKNKLMNYVEIDQYVPILNKLSKDNDIPKFCTNLVYITKANNFYEIESKIIFSIINKNPKRADTYWFVHIDITDQPNDFEYKVVHYEKGAIIKIDLKLGFKVDRKIYGYFKQIVEDLVASGEVDWLSRYPSLREEKIPGDFQFVLIDRIATNDGNFTPFQQFILNVYEILRKIGISESRAFGLDTSNSIVEKVPLLIDPKVKAKLVRMPFEG